MSRGIRRYDYLHGGAARMGGEGAAHAAGGTGKALYAPAQIPLASSNSIFESIP